MNQNKNFARSKIFQNKFSTFFCFSIKAEMLLKTLIQKQASTYNRDIFVAALAPENNFLFSDIF